MSTRQAETCRVALAALVTGAALFALVAPVPVLAQGSDADARDERARDIDEGCPPGEVGEADLADRDELSAEERAAVDCVFHYGIARGRDGSYVPDEPVRRDQMASFIARVLMAGGRERPPAEELPDAFRDDDPCAEDDEECAREGGHTTPAHEHNIDWLAQLGVVDGDEAGRFHATRPVRRDQMASFVNRQIEVLTGAGVASGPDRFGREDCPDPHDVNVDGLADVGIVQGKGDGTYGCAERVDRGQMALFVARDLDFLFEDRGVDISPVDRVEVVVDATTVDRGGVLAGEVVTRRDVTSLTVSGCGLDGVDVALDDERRFAVALPESTPPGGCRVEFTVEVAPEQA